MKIALVDDDVGSAKCLEEILSEKIEGSASVERFSSGESFLSTFRPESFDLIVLDIFMGELTGIETARKIREKDKTVKLVFCTSSNEFACESYEVGACYYLRKPFSDEKIEAMLDRLELDKLELLRSLSLPDGQKVTLRSVVFADFSSHCTVFHQKGGAKTVSRVPFSEIEPLLCEYSYFFSPAKGVVVNFFEVVSQDGDIFLLSDGTRIPISRRKFKAVKEAYARFRFEALRNGGDR